jgi:DNA-binding NarL/FixJ family response regulator
MMGEAIESRAAWPRSMTQGRSIKEIAQAMSLNPKTVANHQWAIRQKLGAETAIQLFMKAALTGLVPPH